MLSKTLNFSIADGFAITTHIYDEMISKNGLECKIRDKLESINDTSSIDQINEVSADLKKVIMDAFIPADLEDKIVAAYNKLRGIYCTETIEVAVRSSALAEDLPNASFAGQQDTFLNITGENALIVHVKMCFASLFNARAISYRRTHNIALVDVKISVAVQKMVRSDMASAGVAFSIDPETGYSKAIVINSAFGLGELVVSGGVTPDEFILDKRILKDVDSDPIIMKKKGLKKSKIIYGERGIVEVKTTDSEQLNFSLTNNQAIMLARIVLRLETAYSKLFKKEIGVDVEWAIDGCDQGIYVIQTRPETVHNNDGSMKLNTYTLTNPTTAPPITSGIAVGDKISNGRITVLKSIDEHKKFKNGDILVTDITTPDWEPLMKISSGVITNKGGRTCHAAIVARELGINAVVGTGNCTEVLNNIATATICCSGGERGLVYNGRLDYEMSTITISHNKTVSPRVKLMLNVGNPESSFHASKMPNNGVGLARMEFIISTYIRIHPLALCDYPNIETETKECIRDIIGNHDSGKWYFIKRLARGIAKIASAFFPKDVIVRLSDFKSNEYKNLIGGALYEPNEENPMIGWRGASRYYSDEYERAFELECQGIKYARETMGMTNVIVMIPFCRTPEECALVIDKMAKYGLVRGENGLKVYLMCEIPSNVIESDRFAPLIDGVSIGGNDLLQLTIGVDRDSEKITHLSSDKNMSYRRLISMAIKEYKARGVKVGFCGQQPSDSMEFCQFLMDEGIDSISVIPDSVPKILGTMDNDNV